MGRAYGEIYEQGRGGDEGDGEGRGEVGRGQGVIAWIRDVGRG